MREAHAAARLNHPGIVTLYELGSQNGCAYLVSELVEGPNLREMAGRGELSDREVADLGAELCSALAHAHDAGVVHRDIKPDNVLVRTTRSRSVKGRASQRALLADFGIASLEDGPTLTATGQVVGTLQYMSPEQATGEGAGSPSDVYSLGLTLYELWAGFNPVARISPAATARAIGEPIESLGEARPELPPALCVAIDACLEPEPEDRPELSDLREALLDVRGALHPGPRGAAPRRGARRGDASSGSPRPPVRDPARRRRGRPARRAGRPARPRDHGGRPARSRRPLARPAPRLVRPPPGSAARADRRRPRIPRRRRPSRPGGGPSRARRPRLAVDGGRRRSAGPRNRRPRRRDRIGDRVGLIRADDDRPAALAHAHPDGSGRRPDLDRRRGPARPPARRRLPGRCRGRRADLGRRDRSATRCCRRGRCADPAAGAGADPRRSLGHLGPRGPAGSPALPTFASPRTYGRPDGESQARSGLLSGWPSGARARPRSRGSPARRAIRPPHLLPTSASARPERRPNTCERHSMEPDRMPGCPRIHGDIRVPAGRRRWPESFLP